MNTIVTPRQIEPIHANPHNQPWRWPLSRHDERQQPAPNGAKQHQAAQSNQRFFSSIPPGCLRHCFSFKLRASKSCEPFRGCSNLFEPKVTRI